MIEANILFVLKMVQTNEKLGKMSHQDSNFMQVKNSYTNVIVLSYKIFLTV